MMVELLDPKYGERICDPSCGTAGFLVSSFEHILKYVIGTTFSSKIPSESLRYLTPSFLTQ